MADDALVPVAPKKMGRPTIYDPNVIQRLLDAVGSGVTLSAVTREDWCPSRSVLYEWQVSHPDFADALARARRLGAPYMADEALGLVDAVDPDSSFGSARVSKAREQVGVRKWLAGVYDPAYRDAGATVNVQVNNVQLANILGDPRPMREGGQ